jgi:hypothetical protein
MKHREVMQQALDALRVATTPLAQDRQEVLSAIKALTEALALPDVQPVAWCSLSLNDIGFQRTQLKCLPLYTHTQPDIAPVCRPDGRCQYAIGHSAEGLGHCPQGKCCMPAQPVIAPAAEFTLRGTLAASLKCWHRLTADEAAELVKFVGNVAQSISDFDAADAFTTEPYTSDVFAAYQQGIRLAERRHGITVAKEQT